MMLSKVYEKLCVRNSSNTKCYPCSIERAYTKLFSLKLLNRLMKYESKPVQNAGENITNKMLSHLTAVG